MVPPPTRGSTHAPLDALEAGAGSPAHAGIDLHPRGSCRTRLRFPRPRGDRPLPSPGRRPHRLVPPPTRGSTRDRLVRASAEVGSPAHAGIDPGTCSAASGRLRFPRPRGDRPKPVTSARGKVMVPPPTRGSTALLGDLVLVRLGSPAHAGIDPSSKPAPAPPCRFPRPRGDRPLHAPEHYSGFEVPPPTRGSTQHRLRQGNLDLGSPAHAGIDPSASAARRRPRRFPRPRGDRPSIFEANRAPTAVPSPTRGSTLQAGRPGVGSQGSPAHAGIDPRRRPQSQGPHRFPRPRGDRPG